MRLRSCQHVGSAGAPHHRVTEVVCAVTRLHRNPREVTKIKWLIFSTFPGERRSVEIALAVLLLVDIVLGIVAVTLELYYLESVIEDYEDCTQRGDCPAHSDHLGDHNIEDAEHKVSYASIAILCIFLLDHVLLFVAIDFAWFKSPLHVFDFVTTVVSLYFEIALGAGAAISLVVVSRAWRFIRLGQGVEEYEHHVAELKESKEH